MSGLLGKALRGKIPRRSRRRQSNAKSKNSWDETESFSHPLTAEMKIQDIDKVEIKDSSQFIDGNICLLRDSPLAMIKAACKGKLSEVERLYFEDKTRLSQKDDHGRSALHKAAANGHVAVINFILDHGGDIDAHDVKGNTVLHYAVENSQVQVIDVLVSRKASTTMWNCRDMAPIHLAVENDKVDSLEALLRHTDRVDPDLCGQEGATPLHYAAYRDRPQCAEKLLHYRARLCKPSNIGLFPFHIAAMHAHSATMEVMLKHGEKNGYPRKKLLSFQDNGKNMPLHTAVTSGNINAVNVCLRAGAPVDAVQDDKSTAVHLAASQGALDMVKAILTHDKGKTEVLLSSRDNMEMTPLHKAALFDRVQVVNYLVEKGSDINAVDSEGRSPVMLAAEKGAWNVIITLLDHGGVDFCVKDNKNRNMMHVIVQNGGDLNLFKCRYGCSDKFLGLFNQQDETGCTPLHYASKQGYLKSIVGLLDGGANLNVKNHRRESPLHFAATYGRYNSCKRLIDRATARSNINEVDACGRSPLHCAAENGHVKVVRLLLQCGGYMNRNKKGNTALHLAAANGYTHTMEALLCKHPHLLNSKNSENDTALHLAAANGHSKAVCHLMSAGADFTKNRQAISFFDLAVKNEHKDVCTTIITHDRWNEALDMCSAMYGSAMGALIQHQPEVFKVVLDRCMTKSPHDKTDKDFHYTIDFKYMQAPHRKVRDSLKSEWTIKPLASMNRMIEHNREQLLSHPVCSTYLQMKWRAYGLLIHATNLLIYSIFLIALTTFISTFPPRNHHDFNSSAVYSNSSQPPMYWQFTHAQKICVLFIFIFCALNAIKEVLQMIQQRWKYLRDPNNLVEWTLYISTALFIGPCLVNMSTHAQWQSGAISVFFAWFNLLLFLQRFDLYGIYVVMFQQILKTLLQVLLAFSILIIAFGMAFYVLMSGSNTVGYQSPALSLMTTFMMMVGNIDYRDSWVIPLSEGTLHFHSLSFVFLAVFVLLMPILLMNLLIGLAVGDIESVQKQAKLKRIAMQVESYTELERKLPLRFLEYVDKTTWKYYPNGSYYFFQKLWGKLVGSRAINLKTDDIGSGSDDCVDHNSYLYNEMRKQKQRMRYLTNSMDKQHELLKLIIQKMEIRGEAEEDEDDIDEPPPTPTIGMWQSTPMRHALLTQRVASNWQRKPKT